MKPMVEFFSEDVDGVEYLNVGLVWENPWTGDESRAVLGAFTGELEQQSMIIIKGLVEQAGIYMLDLEDDPIEVASKEVVESPGGGSELWTP
jgi:hypothetical protein